MEKIILLVSFGLCFSAVFLYSSEYQDSVQLNQSFELVQDTCEASSLMLEYEWLVEKGHYQLAIPYLEKAQLFYKKHQLWEKYVDAFIELSVLGDHFDNETKADYAHQALVNAKRYLNAKHALLGLAYRQKGEAYSLLEKDDSSCYYVELAIPILTQARRWEDVAMCKLQLVVNYYYLGNYAKGTALLEDDFWKKDFHNEDVLSTLYDLQGVYYAESGDFDKSIQTTQNALLLSLPSDHKTAIDSLHIANHLNNLGDTHNIKGDQQRALDYFRQALLFLPQEDLDLKAYIIIENNIGKILWIQEKYREAIRIFKRSEYHIMTSAEPEVYSGGLEDIFYHLGLSYASINRYDSAHFYLEKALSLPNSKKLTTPNLGLGYLYNQLNEPEKALQYLNQALADSIYFKGRAKGKLARIYYRIGDAYVLQKKYHEALSYYQKSLIENTFSFNDAMNLYKNPSLKEKIHERILFLDALQAKAQTLALISSQTDNIKASLEAYQLSIQFADSLRAYYVLEDNELFWSERYKKIYEGAIHIAYCLFEKEKDGKYLELAFSLSEKSKANLLLEAFKTHSNIGSGGVPAAILQEERRLNLDVAFYEKALGEAKANKDSAKTSLYQNYLSTARLELAQLKEEMEWNYPAFHSLKYGGQHTNITTLQASLLDEQSALVEYFFGEEHTYAFVLRQDNLEVVTLPPSATIHDALTAFQKALLHPEAMQHNAKKAFSDYNQVAYQLYKTVLEKPLAHLPASVNQLIIVPDGELTTLPFEVLNTIAINEPSQNFGQLPYLLNSYRIRYGYSAKMLLENQKRQNQLSPNTKCLAFAPPYQNGQTVAQSNVRAHQLRNGITPLDYTASEIAAIRKHFKGTFDASPNATKTHFLEKVNQFGLLHLAMHGEANFEHTKFGHLIFSNVGMSDREQNNLLFNYEITNLQLNAQLAVLSACETGLGKYEAGEGVFSLARSFMYAGVPSVIMSLWKVNDQSTSQLLPEFYRQLAKDKPKDEALHQAKLVYLNKANLEYRHPFYWSCFVALGDAQPLNRPANKVLFWSTLALVLATTGGWFFYNRK